MGLARGKAKPSVSVSASFDAFDTALRSGKVPTEGKITDRTVRAAFGALTRAADLPIDAIPNPLPAPHNLTWYFGKCTCADEVRAFATNIRKKHIRIWSVAKVQDGFRVLAQVFGATSPGNAIDMVELETRMPAKRMRQYLVAGVQRFDLKPGNIECFMHEVARGLLRREGFGDFVEVVLDRTGR